MLFKNATTLFLIVFLFSGCKEHIIDPIYNTNCEFRVGNYQISIPFGYFGKNQKEFRESSGKESLAFEIYAEYPDFSFAAHKIDDGTYNINSNDFLYVAILLHPNVDKTHWEHHPANVTSTIERIISKNKNIYYINEDSIKKAVNGRDGMLLHSDNNILISCPRINQGENSLNHICTLKYQSTNKKITYLIHLKKKWLHNWQDIKNKTVALTESFIKQ